MKELIWVAPTWKYGPRNLVKAKKKAQEVANQTGQRAYVMNLANKTLVVTFGKPGQDLEMWETVARFYPDPLLAPKGGLSGLVWAERIEPKKDARK